MGMANVGDGRKLEGTIEPSFELALETRNKLDINCGENIST